MKQRILIACLALITALALIPSIAAKNAAEKGETTAAFGGSLNASTDLLFDFTNSTADQTRYKSSAYGGYNFDTESNGYWATGYNGTKTNYSISNANGTLRVKVTDGADASGTYGPWIKVTNTYGTAPSYNEASRPYYPLNFNPKNVNCVTIRFKLSGCYATGGQIPKVVFEYYYTKGGTYSYGNDMSASFVFQDGYYQSVTIPVSSKLKGADILKGFGLRFRNVRGTNGTIYIDHIYIGADAEFVMANHGDRTFLSQSVNPIVSGVNEAQVYLKDQSDSTQMAGFMATVAPSAKVTLKASYPGYYTKGSTAASRKSAAPTLAFQGATTTAQAAAYETATGETVYLAINADFFNMETFQPRGQLALEGNVIQTYGTRATPFFAVLKDGSYAIRAFGSPMGDVKEAVAGLHWLVKNGTLVTNNDVERHPRTAIGLKADGTVVIFAVDGRQEPYSVGMTLQELADYMYAAGCVNAINLDGGGSTTFATRYNNGASPLTIRNSPCDSTGERVVTSTLLLVAQSCKHSFNKDFTVHENGTHSVCCTSCGEKITVSHTYKNGVCACGDKQHIGTGLFFGFSNNDFDQYRYMDPAYKYYNFDQTDNGKWNRGGWYTGYTATAQDYIVDNAAGTLTVKVSDHFSGSEANGNLTYGPWLKITNADGVGPQKDNGTHRPLHYNPENVEEVRLRFKITGCTVPTGKTPRVYFEYYFTKDGTYTGATNMYADYAFTEGEYVTVSIPASATLKDADVLTGFGLRFQNIKSTSGGKLVLDYIYIGEKASDTLLFHFDNSAAAKARYQSPGYGFINFDTASKGYWSTYYNGANTNFTVNPHIGTLDVTVTEGYSSNSEGTNIIYGPWVKTTNTYGKFTGKTTYDYFPLSYDPKNGEHFQIRFKTTNCEVDTGKTPKLVLEYYYTQDGAYAYANNIASTYSLKNGEYQILTIPLSAKFKAADEILCFGLRFQHIKSSSGGSVNIDYIAIGPNEDLPNPQYTVTFRGEDGTTLETQPLYKEQTAVYSGPTPTKAPDETGHYSFSGWDKDLTNITGNITATSQFALEPHTFTEGICICGWEGSHEPVEDPKLKLNHSLNLASDISVNLAVPKTALEGFDLSTVYVESIIETYAGNDLNGTKAVTLLPVDTGNYYYFTLTGITAVNMNDRIVSVLYGTKDGQPYTSPVDDYAIVDYAYSQLNKTTVPQKLKTLCADLLIYGAKSQIYKNYRTDSLADDAMTEAHRAYCSDLGTVTFGNTNEELADVIAPTVTWKGKALELNAKVGIKYIINLSGFTGKLENLRLKVSYVNRSGETVEVFVTDMQVYNEAGRLYAFTFDGLLAAELRTVVSAQVYEGEIPASATLRYSSDSYGNNKTGNLLEVCKALFAYSDSAEAYFVP